jgi:glucose/arabinose dehydrogenase
MKTVTLIVAVAAVVGASLLQPLSGAGRAVVDAARSAAHIHRSLSGDDPRFALETVVAGLTGPTSFDFLPDGRVIFAEKSGTVRVARDGAVQPQPVLDLSSEIYSGHFHGLLAAAVDPAFSQNGFIYLGFVSNESFPSDKKTRERKGKVVRYTVIDDRVDPQSAFVIVDDFIIPGNFHSIGDIRFGRDGMLFVSFGDGANSDRNQYLLTARADDLDSVNGKILRIDPRTGAGLPNNPFYDSNDPRSARSRVWAYGLRYPFRFAMHPFRDEPYVGEVGLFHYESIVRVTRGARFGWPCLDGIRPHPFARFLRRCDSFRISEISARDIVYEHNRSEAAVIAGDFNFGRMLPEDAYSEFFFADFIRGWLKRASVDAEGRLFRVRPVSTKAGAIVNIRSGPDGSLYMLSYVSGTLQRLRTVAQ